MGRISNFGSENESRREVMAEIAEKVAKLTRMAKENEEERNAGCSEPHDLDDFREIVEEINSSAAGAGMAFRFDLADLLGTAANEESWSSSSWSASSSFCGDASWMSSGPC